MRRRWRLGLLLRWMGRSSLVLLLFMLVGGRKARLRTRLRDLPNRGQNVPEPDPVAQFARAALPKMGATLLPRNE